MKKAFLFLMLGLALTLGLFLGVQNVGATPTPGTFVQLPVLAFLGNTGGVGNDVVIEVQNVGSIYTKAALILFQKTTGFCEPQAPGPFKFECTGLLKPGAAWIWSEAQLPPTAYSGIVVPVAHCPSSLSKLWPDSTAVNSGVPLAVEVLRGFPTATGVEISAAYSGISSADEGVRDPIFGGFMYYAPVVYASFNNLSSWLYIQNSGDECTSVELWFKQEGECIRAQICEVMQLAPGETVPFDVAGCVGPSWAGSVWIRTSQPIGIVVDQVGSDVLMTYTGRPAELNYVFNGEPFYTVGSQVAYGPLIYREEYGWDTRIWVQNLSSVVNAKVKVYFIDNSGDIITTLIDWVCPRGNQQFFLPMINNLPGNYVGQVRVESQEWWSAGDPKVLAPNILGVAELVKYEGPGRTTPLEAMAYNLFPEDQAFDWQGGWQPGVRTIGIPSLHKRSSLDITTELAIGNLNPNPGFTHFAMFIYDQNGLLDFICEKLNEKQVEYVNLNDWGYINAGFKGSAIIWGTYSTQDYNNPIGTPEGAFGLTAVKVERSNATLGVDEPGDESAASEGFPIRGDFGFEGPQIPVCPGQEPGPCGIVTLRYHVVDVNHNDVAGAQVCLSLPSHMPGEAGPGLFCGTTNNNGIAYIANVPTPQLFDVTVTADGFETFGGTVFVECAPTGTVVNERVELTPQFCISGNVGAFLGCRVADEAARLAGATVELWDANGIVDTTTTDSEGAYSFCGVNAGTYHLKVIGQWEGNSISFPSDEFPLAGNAVWNFSVLGLEWCTPVTNGG